MTPPAAPVPIRRILLVALDNLGDLVFASALTTPLRDAFPDASIDVWCKQYTAPIAPLIPHVRHVIAADPFWAAPRSTPRPPIGPFVRSVLAVRRQRYDVAVLSESPWRVAAAVAATRIPMRIGLARHRNTAFLTHVLPAQDARKPVLREQARLLTALGIVGGAPVYHLDATPLDTTRRAVGAVLPARFVALHPFASKRDRCVPLEEWIRLASALLKRGLPTLWVGTQRELAELRASLGLTAGSYVDQLGADGPSLTTTAAALSLASLFVGHDSGPLHMAAAFGIPVVGIFAPGQPERTFPQGRGPWRMIHRATPAGITAESMLREIDELPPANHPA